MKTFTYFLIFITVLINYCLHASWTSSAADVLVRSSDIETYAWGYYPPYINADGTVLAFSERDSSDMNYNLKVYERADNSSDWLLTLDTLIGNISEGIAMNAAGTAIVAESSADDTSSDISLWEKISITGWTNSNFLLPDEFENPMHFVMSADGTKIAVNCNQRQTDSTTSQNVIIVLTFSNNQLIQIGNTISLIDSVSNGFYEYKISADGNNLIIGPSWSPASVPDAGSPIIPVKVYQLSDGLWKQVGNSLYPETQFEKFGSMVEISSNGQKIAISSPTKDTINGVSTGRVGVYELQENTWELIGDYINGHSPTDSMGHSFKINSFGNRIAIGAAIHASYAGHIRVFDYNDGSWNQVGDAINGAPGSDDGIGARFTMSSDGRTIASMNLPFFSSVLPQQSILKTYQLSAPNNDGSIDSDGDGLSDATENSLGTNPSLTDTDADGFPDGWEVSRNLDPTINSSDFISKINEYGYYSADQIKDLRPGSTMVEVLGDQAVIELQMEESSDLKIWENTGDPATMTIQADTDTKFFRFKMAE